MYFPKSLVLGTMGLVLAEINPVPHRAVESVKDNLEWARTLRRDE